MGSLGYGWSHNWDYRLIEVDEGDIILAGPKNTQRIFQPDERGGYFPQRGDFGQLLKRENDQYELVEPNGLKLVFNSEGNFWYVEDPNNNRITAQYSNELLIGLNHSAGRSIEFEYDGNLIQSATDSYGRTTAYEYDTAQRLIRVTNPGWTPEEYTYSTGSRLGHQHALTSISEPGGRVQYFEYDNAGRIESIESNSGVERLEFTYDSVGSVSL